MPLRLLPVRFSNLRFTVADDAGLIFDFDLTEFGPNAGYVRAPGLPQQAALASPSPSRPLPLRRIHPKTTPPRDPHRDNNTC